MEFNFNGKAQKSTFASATKVSCQDQTIFTCKLTGGSRYVLKLQHTSRQIPFSAVDPRFRGLGRDQPNFKVPFKKHFQLADNPRRNAVISNLVTHLALNFLICITILSKMCARQFREINFVVSIRNYLASTSDYIIMQMRRTNR